MQLLAMLAIALFMFLVSAFATAPLMVAVGGQVSRTGLLLSQALTQILTFAVPALAVALIYYRGTTAQYLKLDFGGQKWLYALAGVVVMALVLPAVDWLTEWNKGWDLGRVGEMLRSLQEQTEGVLKTIVATDTVGGLLGNLLVVALVPAVCEELFFRAGLQNLLQRWFRTPHAAVVLTALIFSLAHGELFAFMPRFLLGLVLGYLYVCSGSLLTNVLAHFVNNALVVVLYWLSARGIADIDPEASMGFGALLTVCCTLAAAALFAVTFMKKPHQDS